MKAAAEAVKFLLQGGQIEVEFGLEGENGKIITAGRGLDFFAVGTKESGVVMSD
jgi:hypothetical protein